MDAIMTKRRFTVDEYHRMGCAGIFWFEERVELIDGEIITMPPIGDDHMWSVNHLNRAFVPGLGERAVVSVQNPIRLSEYHEPQPDVALLHPETRMRHATPHPEDVLLLVEVADTTLCYDREVKLPRYAEAGIPELWIVDLIGRRIEVCRDPSGGVYQQHISVGPEDSVSPRAFPDLVLRCAEILG
jgi:Uma2 family endonuclease